MPDDDILTVVFLFATPPSDRALRGWDGADEAYGELVAVGLIDPMTARVA